MSLPALDETTLDDLYKWLHSIPFSRPLRNITRDFSDGALTAELVSYYLPKIIDLHNYSPASSSVQKRYNWNTLNSKVFVKLAFQIPSHVIQQVIGYKPGAVEFVLTNLRLKIDVAICQLSRITVTKSRNTSREGSLLSLDSINTGVQSIPSTSAPPTPRMTRSLAPMVNGSSLVALKNSQFSMTENTRYIGDEQFVPASLLYDTKQELFEKAEQLQVSEARITHLEKLVDLKEDRIAQLADRLDKLSQEVFRQHNAHWNGTLRDNSAMHEAPNKNGKQ